MMVSAPDLSRYGDDRTRTGKATASGSLFYKYREEDSVRRARHSGYFVELTADVIGARYAVARTKTSVLDEETSAVDVASLVVVRFARARLHDVGEVGACRALTVCDLSSNYITQFGALISCVRLIKLDLHANQIATVPGRGFWACLRHLAVLYLHDNPIGDVDVLDMMSASVSVEVLTLYDTPLSLRHSYRHHVVNTLCSLKALDRRVISDEEVIEDAVFTGRFRAVDPVFAMNLCPAPASGNVEDELATVAALRRRVSHVMAHHCPVIILQRHIRAFLTRRWLARQHFPKLWAYRALGRMGVDPRAPPSAPPPCSPNSSKSQLPFVSLDFDTYLMNRRPGSVGTDLAHSSTSPVSGGVSGGASDTALPTTPSLSSATAKKSSPAEEKTRRTEDDGGQRVILIDVKKLQTSRLQRLDEEADLLERNAARLDEKAELLERNAAPLDESSGGSPSEAKSSEVVQLSAFRLRGLRKEIEAYDPLLDMIIVRRESGRELRAYASDREGRRAREEAGGATARKASSVEAARARREGRQRSRLDLLPLWAVSTAYAHRAAADAQAARVQCVGEQRARRVRAAERTRTRADERRQDALAARDADRQRDVQTLSQLAAHQSVCLSDGRAARDRSARHAAERRSDVHATAQFSAQNASVSSAVLRHDRGVAAGEAGQRRGEAVLARAASEADSRRLMRSYLEQRSLLRRSDTAAARTAVDARLLTDANDRLAAARGRVAQCRARLRSVETASRQLPLIDVSAAVAADVGPDCAMTTGVQGSRTPLRDKCDGATSPAKTTGDVKPLTADTKPLVVATRLDVTMTGAATC